MGCEMEQVDTNEWLRNLQQKARTERIPLKAQLELTSRCNLRCQHCYLGDQLEQHRKRSMERDTEAVCKSLDEWAAAGCLQLVITGGDPMMRRDFKEIYRHAAELGMYISVLCDGILVSDAIIDLFREYPPRSVEVSIYGATAETYEKVTQVPGSHALAWKGIHRLLDIGAKVALKTVLLTINEHELGDMFAQAEAVGCPFRFDSAIFPCLPEGAKGDPLSLRVSPEVAVKWDLAVPGRAENFARSIKKAGTFPVSDSLYMCGAGGSAFYADPYGILSPCLMTTKYQYYQGDRSFADLWEHELSDIRKQRRKKQGGCLTGEKLGACTHCPAVNFLETGDEEVESTYTKAVTELRYHAVMENTKEDKENEQ